MLSRPGAAGVLAAQSGTVSATPGAKAPDTPFAIVTLGIRCLPDLCGFSLFISPQDLKRSGLRKKYADTVRPTAITNQRTPDGGSLRASVAPP